VDVLSGRARKACHRGVADRAADLANGLEVAVGSDREARLDDIDPELLQDEGDAPLLLQVHGGAGRLFAVAKGGVEDDDAVAVGPEAHTINPFILRVTISGREVELPRARADS